MQYLRSKPKTYIDPYLLFSQSSLLPIPLSLSLYPSSPSLCLSILSFSFFLPLSFPLSLVRAKGKQTSLNMTISASMPSIIQVNKCQRPSSSAAPKGKTKRRRQGTRPDLKQKTSKAGSQAATGGRHAHPRSEAKAQHPTYASLHDTSPTIPEPPSGGTNLRRRYL